MIIVRCTVTCTRYLGDRSQRRRDFVSVRREGYLNTSNLPHWTFYGSYFRRKVIPMKRGGSLFFVRQRKSIHFKCLFLSQNPSRPCWSGFLGLRKGKNKSPTKTSRLCRIQPFTDLVLQSSRLSQYWCLGRCSESPLPCSSVAPRLQNRPVTVHRGVSGYPRSR